MATLIAVLLASLFGSLHCAGMCGALVAFAVGSTEPHSHGKRVLLQAAYHGGRLVTYAALGAACGLAGAALDLGASLVGLNAVAAVLAGGMMVAVGLVALARYRGVRLPQFPAPRWLVRLLSLGQRAAVGLQPLPRALTIGLLTAFLPCGWLYAFAIIAAGAGSAAWGAAIMATFWLGTVPVLASFGVAVQTLAGTLGRRLPLATAVLLVLLGLGTLAQRWAISSEALTLPPDVTAEHDTAEQVRALQDITPPCCRREH